MHEVTIEEETTRALRCSVCGVISDHRPRPLRDAENEAHGHELEYVPEPEDA